MIEQEEATIPGKPILSYFRRLFVAADQLLNVILGGHEDETISSRIAKDRRRGRKFACILCRVLDWLDPNHCEKALEKDEGKRPGPYDAPRRKDYPPRSDWS
jgi:hypothetical protein